MAKINIKSEKLTPFGGIFLVRNMFSRYVGPVINDDLDTAVAQVHDLIADFISQ